MLVCYNNNAYIVIFQEVKQMAKITKTAKLKITNYRGIFEETLQKYRSALGFIVDIVNREWHILYNIGEEKHKINYIERWIHCTKKNPAPKYNFDSYFYKFPSYLRRSAIAEAIGIVSSYRSNYDNWLQKKQEVEAKGKKFKDNPPRLQFKHKSFPVMYSPHMFKKHEDGKASIKVFHQNDWIWIDINYDTSNLINRDLDAYKEMNPALVKNGKKFFLHVPYERRQKLKNTPIKKQIIISVDLGLNNSAVCSAMYSDGTIIGRKFIDQPIEKDRLSTMVNKLAKANRQSGKGRKPNCWRRINGLQKHITQDTANQIVEFAREHNADVIVFERLGPFKPPKGLRGSKRLRRKLHFWAKKRVQKKTEKKAHRYGIRLRRVNPKNTSSLAFDGSGEVTRSDKKDICVFPTGKVYHADLSASYNIGARYFIRELLKPFSEKKRLRLEAKVPSVAVRTKCTLASLISLNKAM